MHSIMSYSASFNMYTRYCNHSLTHNRVVGGNRTVNIVTTRSVNRPNARLAVHAFRVNNTTSHTTTRSDVRIGGGNDVGLDGIGSIIGSDNGLIVASHGARLGLVSRFNHAGRDCGMPCNTMLTGNSNRRITNNRAITG